MKVIITKKKGLPRHQIQGLVDCPVGMKRDPMTGQCVQDLTFDESTIPRPPMNEDTSLPSAEAQRFSAVVGQRGLYDNERVTATELDKIWRSGERDVPSAKKTLSNLEKATALTAFLQGVGSTLQASQQEETARKREIKRGMSDNYFPTVPYYTSRGTTEINTGEMLPNMQVPVQFPGTRVAPYYGQFQLGALVPSIPYEVDEAQQYPTYFEEPASMASVASSTPSNVSGSVIVDDSEASNIANSGDEMAYTHNNPLNIHIGNFAKKYGGVKGKKDAEGHVAIFPSLEAGIQAAKDLLFSPNGNYINLTISQARKRWVGFDNAGTRNSIKDIVSIIGGDKRLADLTTDEREKLIKGFAKWEGRKAYNQIKNMDLYKEGGEYELTDDEIDYILANGGEIEYL